MRSEFRVPVRMVPPLARDVPPLARDVMTTTDPRHFRSQLIGLVLSATAGMLGACSGNSNVSDGPGWSLADKTPVALGAAGASTKTTNAAASPYDYRGGRDPVTGRAATIGAPEPAIAGETTDPVPRMVQIKKGDTLHGLSLTYHVSVKAIMAANNLTSSLIIPGKTLVIPQG